ncbi:MAG: GTPase ObgE [Phycisphaerae bacterium]|jgi:GTP-binding protein|nr:GTPase ObgE [Phycisphaerae bacterium]
MFVDQADIVVTAGNGGNGCMAFRREKYIPKGGPAGGDGGKGGNVFIQADDSYNTLQHLAGHHHWSAENGRPGEGKNKHGRGGADVVVRVPPGTIIYDAEKGITLKDLSDPGEQVCVAHGGKGGRGNSRFKSATNQAPRQWEPGEEGQERKLHLELKLIADAGLLGLPNAGKSTLTSRVSAARPKIAAYPFTTLHPCLGIVELSRFRRFVLADIPGIIEGAHEGAGLGDAFLRHIERTRVLVHMVDICPLTGDPVANYHAIRGELEQYSPALAAKPEIVVANKMDLTGSDERLAEFSEAVAAPVVPISAVTGKGLEALGEVIWRKITESIELETGGKPSKPPLGVSKTFDPPEPDNDD